MSLPKEPRQKMINLMYLVLTALLALNVSSEILNAFKTVKTSLDNSTGVAYGKTMQLFKSFESKIADPATKEKATLWNEKAERAHKLAEDMNKYIDELEMELKKEAGYNPPKDTAYKIDDLEAATRLFISNEDKKKTPKGKELYNKLVEFKKNLLAVDTAIGNELAGSLPLNMPATYGEGAHDWGNTYFHMTPTIAGLTILSKFQNDIRNSEMQVVEACHKKIGEVIFTYDEFKVIANASSSYMMPGEEFTISAGIGAYSSKAQPIVSVGGMGSAVKTPEGDYMVKGTSESAPGEYSKTVNISYKDQETGQMKNVTRVIKYTVGVPAGLTISTDKTRVFYAGGVENELSVTGSGGAEKIALEITGPGNIEKTRVGNSGQYIVKCNQAGKASVTVSEIGGKGRPVTIEIPIKKLPDPTIKFGNTVPGDISIKDLRIAQGMAARMPEDFLFADYKWTVVSFRMYFTGPGFEDGSGNAEVQGNRWNEEARKAIAKCKDGTAIIVDQVVIVGSAGERRTVTGAFPFTVIE